MKKMRFLMVGLMLSTVLVMTAIGCDNDSSDSVPLSHADFEGTWELIDGNYRTILTVTPSALEFEEYTRTGGGASWTFDGEYTETIVTSATVGSLVTITAVYIYDAHNYEVRLTNSDNTATITAVEDGTSYNHKTFLRK